MANIGRYSGFENVSDVGPDLPRRGKAVGGKLHIVHAAVTDPNPGAPKKDGKTRRQRVAVNRSTDVLENVYARRRLSEGAYQAGRLYQRILEVSRGRRSGKSIFDPDNRGNPIDGHEHAILTALQNAEKAVALLNDVRQIIGLWAEHVLTRILGDGATLSEVTREQGKTSRWARANVGVTFCEALESLALTWEQWGGPPPA